MKKIFIFITILALASMFMIGCSSDETSMSADYRLQMSADYSLQMAPIIIPQGATITSATLNIWVLDGNYQTVNVHRVTEDWDEMSVTWNSFGGAFDATVEGSFVAIFGWYSTDITSLFNSWADGTYENFGVLIDQVEMNYPRAIYTSREHTLNHAYLEVCYMDGGNEICEQTEVIADTYIWETAPEVNNGSFYHLFTGWKDPNDLEKQSLLRFEIERNPQEGCSHTIGFWKTHAGFGPQADEVTQYLPIMLGSFEVSDATIAVDVLKMKTYGAPNNGITKLMAQLLGAKLSVASGASDGDIASDIADADAFLNTYDWTDWNSLSKSQKNDVNNMMSTFDDFNNGYIGPGHCDEFNPEHDYSYGEGKKGKKHKEN